MNRRYIVWSLVILWMVMIFSLSGETKDISSSRSQKLTAIVHEVMEKLPKQVKTTIEKDKISEHLLRKASHVLEYFILTCFVIFASIKSGVNKYRVYFNAFIIPIAFACTDEMHQYFTPGRGPQVMDILTDSIGVVIAISLFLGLTLAKSIYIYYKEARV